MIVMSSCRKESNFLTGFSSHAINSFVSSWSEICNMVYAAAGGLRCSIDLSHSHISITLRCACWFKTHNIHAKTGSIWLYLKIRYLRLLLNPVLQWRKVSCAFTSDWYLSDGEESYKKKKQQQVGKHELINPVQPLGIGIYEGKEGQTAGQTTATLLNNKFQRQFCHEYKYSSYLNLAFQLYKSAREQFNVFKDVRPVWFPVNPRSKCLLAKLNCSLGTLGISPNCGDAHK